MLHSFLIDFFAFICLLKKKEIVSSACLCCLKIELWIPRLSYVYGGMTLCTCPVILTFDVNSNDVLLNAAVIIVQLRVGF